MNVRVYRGPTRDRKGFRAIVVMSGQTDSLLRHDELWQLLVRLNYHEFCALAISPGFLAGCTHVYAEDSLSIKVWKVNFGPAICLPHLIQRDWMYSHKVFRDDGAWLSNGITLPLAPLTLGLRQLSLEKLSSRLRLGRVHSL